MKEPVIAGVLWMAVVFPRPWHTEKRASSDRMLIDEQITRPVRTLSDRTHRWPPRGPVGDIDERHRGRPQVVVGEVNPDGRRHYLDDLSQQRNLRCERDLDGPLASGDEEPTAPPIPAGVGVPVLQFAAELRLGDLGRHQRRVALSSHQRRHAG